MRIFTRVAFVSIDSNRKTILTSLWLLAFSFVVFQAMKNNPSKNNHFIKASLPAFSFAMPAGGADIPYAFVFVSRTHREFGSVYWDEPKDMPGVGVFSRYRDSSPG